MTVWVKGDQCRESLETKAKLTKKMSFCSEKDPAMVQTSAGQFISAKLIGKGEKKPSFDFFYSNNCIFLTFEGAGFDSQPCYLTFDTLKCPYIQTKVIQPLKNI